MKVVLDFCEIFVCDVLQRQGVGLHLLLQLVDFLDGGFGLVGSAEHHHAGDGCDECEFGLSHGFGLKVQRYAICRNHTKKPDCICGDSRDRLYEYEFFLLGDLSYDGDDVHV